MNVSDPLLVCMAAALVIARLAAHRGWEQRNIARLAAHFGWLPADASRAYGIAREVGFGTAYRTVMGGSRRQPT